MKDIRGSHASAVRGAIFRTLGLQLISSKWRKNSQDILKWKKSKEVADGYKKLYASNDTTIEDIVATAFPSSAAASEEVFNDIYIYTASVCDIILNPNYPNMEISKKPLELRFNRFKVFIEFNLSFKKKKLNQKLISLLGNS
jgi:hypothetical protein